MIPLKQFATAGNATFTVSNLTTGNRFTFRVKQSKNPSAKHLRFVQVLTGNNNENSYEFLGTLFPSVTGFYYAHGKRSRITSEAPSAKCFAWLWRYVDELAAFPQVQIRHAGKCCRCGRKLTVPNSVLSGVGPECAGKMN
jgi:hypothetical protein